MNVAIPLPLALAWALTASGTLVVLAIAMLRLARRHLRNKSRLAMVERAAMAGTWQTDAALRGIAFSEGAAVVLRLERPVGHPRELLGRIPRPDRSALLRSVRAVRSTGQGARCVVRLTGSPSRLQVDLERECRADGNSLRGTVMVLPPAGSAATTPADTPAPQ